MRLLVIWVVFLSACAMFGIASDCEAEAMAPIGRIEELGGHVRFDEQGRLKGVEFEGTNNTHQILEELTLLRGCEGIVELSFAGGDFDDRSARHIASFPMLARLQLINTPITDAGVRDISDSQSLRFAHIEGGSISNKALAYLSKVRNLEGLSLASCDVTDDGLRHVPQMKLQKLALRNVVITDKGLAVLRDCKELKEVYISQIDGIGDGAVKCLPMRIQYLELASTSVSDAGVAKLAEYGNLVWLSIADTKVSDESVAHLIQLRRLRLLSVMGTHISSSGMSRLRMHLPHCRIQ